MSLPTRPVVAKALRSTANPTVSTVKPRHKVDPPEVVLRKHVETLLFHAHSIAPRQPLLSKSFDATVAHADWDEMDDEELVTTWESEVHRLRSLFIADPASWEDEHSLKFREGCVLSFGIRDERYIRLIQQFHNMPGPRRLAIMVLLERSAAFKWIIEQVDHAPDGWKVENADESFRLLMNKVWGGKL